jgi:hypothetical protein
MNDPSKKDELAAAVAGLAESDLDKASRARMLGRLVGGLRERGVKGLYAPRKALGWIVDAVSDLAPHIPVRTLATLREHYPGLDGDELAQRLIRNASRATGGVGALGGGIASVEWAAPPALLSTPVLLATETVAVVAVELKLIGELHEIYGPAITGSTTQKAMALLQGWAGRRGVNPLVPGGAMATVLGTGDPQATPRLDPQAVRAKPHLPRAVPDRRGDRQLSEPAPDPQAGRGGRSRPQAASRHTGTSAAASRSGCRELITQYGVGSPGSSSTTCTAPAIQGRWMTNASGSAAGPSRSRFWPASRGITSAITARGRRASSTRNSDSVTVTRMRPSHQTPHTDQHHRDGDRDPRARTGRAQADFQRENGAEGQHG